MSKIKESERSWNVVDEITDSIKVTIEMHEYGYVFFKQGNQLVFTREVDKLIETLLEARRVQKEDYKT